MISAFDSNPFDHLYVQRTAYIEPFHFSLCDLRVLCGELFLGSKSGFNPIRRHSYVISGELGSFDGNPNPAGTEQGFDDADYFLSLFIAGWLFFGRNVYLSTIF